MSASTAGLAALDEQADWLAMLRDAAADFARGELGPQALRAVRGGDPPFDAARWSLMATLGWPGLLVDEAHGGSAAGLEACCAVLGELGQALAPEPLVACGVLAVVALQGAGPGELRDGLLRGVAAGTERPGVAHEPATADDAGVRAWQERGHWVLAGDSRFVRPGRGATGWIVRATTDAGPVLLWVPPDPSASGVRHEPLADGGDAAWLHFEAALPHRAALLAGPAQACRALERAVAAARIAVAAELLGVMRGAMARTLEHLRTRRQFGAAIGSFQALQHRAVDLHLQHELTSACVERAAQRFDAGADPRELSLLAAHAKARAADAALLTGRETLQFHGAMGYTDECDIGLYFKRGLSLAAWLGNASQLRREYARLRYGTPTGQEQGS